MREFDIELNNYVTTGLSPTKQGARHQPGFDLCKEVIVTESGLRARPLIHDLSVDFPTLGDYDDLLPRVFDLNKVPLCANAAGVYRIDVTNPILISALQDVDTVVDFFDFVFVSNGTDSNELLLDNGLFTNITPTTKSYPEPTTACGFKEAQGFIGSGDKAYWSSISRFDFTIGTEGDAGNQQVTFPGDILRVLELGDHVVCYGDEGIMILDPLPQPRGAWKVNRLKQLRGIGLRDFESVTSLGDKHYFVGNDDNLWEIGTDLSFKRLGYDYLLGSEGVIELVPMNLHHAVYLVSDNNSYIYTGGGLSNIQHVSRSLMPYYSGDEKIAGFPTSPIGFDQFEIRTNAIDFKHRQPKFIQAIEVGLENDYDVECQVLWRNDIKAEYRATPWVRVCPAGYAQTPCTGVDFKIAIRGKLSQNFALNTLKAKIKYENKSNLRGKYAY